MSLSPLMWTFLVLALILAIGAFSLLKKKGNLPKAGGRAPVRYPRSPQKKQEGLNPVKITIIATPLVFIAVWLTISYIHRQSTETAQSPAPIVETAVLTPTLSGRLTPPPPLTPQQATSLAPSTQETANEVLVQPPPPPPVPSQERRFTPNPEENQASQFSPMSQAAQNMAPIISRYEPVGRKLNQAKKPEPTLPQTTTRPKLGTTPALPPQNRLQQENKSISPSPIASTGRKYTVLLGSFSKPENANQLKSKLEDSGLPAIISEVTIDNKVRFRVMSGSFEDQSSAEAYGRELKQKKLVDRPFIQPM